MSAARPARPARRGVWGARRCRAQGARAHTGSVGPAGRLRCGARTDGPRHNSLRASRCAQTNAASQFTKQACPSAGLQPVRPALLADPEIAHAPWVRHRRVEAGVVHPGMTVRGVTRSPPASRPLAGFPSSRPAPTVRAEPVEGRASAGTKPFDELRANGSINRYCARGAAAHSTNVGRSTAMQALVPVRAWRRACGAPRSAGRTGCGPAEGQARFVN